MCPGTTDLTVAVGSTALLTAFVAGMVGHGVLRPLLEARGIAPWRLRDSLGSLPVVLAGSAMLGGTAGLLVVWGVTGCATRSAEQVVASAVVLGSVIAVRLGLIGLRKLV